MLWNGRRVPFTLLGGYLGAGKTTVVNHVVRNAEGRRIVVLVNDVAAVNIDAALIADHDGTTLSLTNGCVCCAIADDFAQTLEQIRAIAEPPDQVLMELSGVGEPARVAPWASTAGFRLDGIVVLADADQIVELSKRDYVADTIVEQLRAADLVLLTKTDLAADGGSGARALVRSCTSAPVLVVVNGAVDIDVVLGLDRVVEERPTDHPPRASYTTSLLDVDRPMRTELEHLVASLRPDVIRAKGVVRCSDELDPVEVQVVGTRRTLRSRPDLAESAAGHHLVVIELTD
jgi:G3E family GTPase